MTGALASPAVLSRMTDRGVLAGGRAKSRFRIDIFRGAAIMQPGRAKAARASGSGVVLVNGEAELADLLRSAIAGDEKAYAGFLSKTAGLIRGFARRRTANGGIDAEDIVQETLLAIHLKRHTWMADAPVLPWVYAIARYKLIDAFRRRGRRIELDIDDFAELAGAPREERPSGREVGRALDALPAGQRSVVASISVDGRSISETAARLGMNEVAVRVSLHRGLAAIAKKFGKG